MYGKTRDPIIPYSLDAIRSTDGSLSIPNLARQIAVIQRHLERLFQQHVGMSPKPYAQLLRVDKVRLTLKQLSKQPTFNLAHIAADFCFYDQSHFIREFRAVVGKTPMGYFQRSSKHTP